MRSIIVAAALLGLLLVAAGAAGAHTVPIDANRQWESALLYGFVHTLAAILAAILPFRSWLQIASGWAFVISVTLFSGVQIAKIMMAGIPVAPTPLDNLTFLVPVGGVAFIVGWLLLGLSAAMAPRQSADRDQPDTRD
ncbi:MAG: DUF423 domain-containing protein [Hyphomonadaceae bacterium]|nr:DUF423 domain-containing protein [Hyphomonadaceae bacterium]